MKVRKEMKLLNIISLVSTTSGFLVPKLHQRNVPPPIIQKPSWGMDTNHLYHYKNLCRSTKTQINYKKEDGNDDEEEMDWREFRARLVSTYDMPQKEKESNPDTSLTSSNNDSSWMYESGSSIETGSILLHKVDDNSDDSGYGLARQYLHKSVILILEHDNVESTMSTKGVILNRPTDLILHEPSTKGLEHANFPIWFGGSHWGLHTENPKFFCLHSINSIAAKRISKQVMKGINYTSVSMAKSLITNGQAKPSDFYFFAGYLEWENGELLNEIENGLWNTIAADASIVRKGMKILTGQDVKDVENAGVKTWTMMMDLMHKHGNSKYKYVTKKQSFEDKILHEWAREKLFFKEAPLFMRDELNEDGEDTDVGEVVETITGNVLPGTLLRGSSACTSFLLSDQEFHKSMILVVQDDQELSVGLILNLPSDRTFDASIRDDSKIFKSKFSTQLPLRYGGQYGGISTVAENDEDSDDDDDDPLFILHMSPTLRDANIGQPIGENFNDGIWSCTTQEYASAIASYKASPDEFMCIDGFCLWTKHLTESGNVGGGVIEEVMKGHFEIVPHVRTSKVWHELLQQEILSEGTLHKNFNIFDSAWSLADQNWRKDRNDDDKTDKYHKLSLLNDEALKRWMMIYLQNDD